MSNFNTALAEALAEMNKVTNADRIRAMSDEELADFIIGAVQRGGKPIYGKQVKWPDWLKQEAGVCVDGLV